MCLEGPSSHLNRTNLSELKMSRNEVEWQNGICDCFNDCSLCKLTERVTGTAEQGGYSRLHFARAVTY